MKMKYIFSLVAIFCMAFGGIIFIPNEANGEKINLERLFYKNGRDSESGTDPYCTFDITNFQGSDWPTGSIDIDPGDTLDLKLKCKTFCHNNNNYDDGSSDEDHFKTKVQSEYIFSSSIYHYLSTWQIVDIDNTDNPRFGYFLEEANEYTFRGLQEGDWAQFYWEINVVAYDKDGERLMDSDADSVTVRINII